MPLKEPGSMDECVYFTNRTVGVGSIRAWVYKKTCPQCKKGKLQKPMKKNGKIDKKSLVVICNACGFEMPTEESEQGLSMDIIYTCPHCSSSGEATTAYQRKKFHGVDAYIFQCQRCHEKIPITKKLKETKE